jgi:parallel beta helix pectate lyase-like protein
MALPHFSRRTFLSTVGGVIGAGALRGRLLAEPGPPARTPRATSGDRQAEPKWSERLTLTVGQQQGDLVGKTDKAIQAAVDTVARLGGGTVKVLPGTYEMHNTIWLSSGVRLVGSGPETILHKCGSVNSKLVEDSDWYDQEITLANAKGFEVGHGICLETRNPHNGGRDVYKGTLVARSGNRFKLSKPLGQNFWLTGESKVSTLFPLITSEFTEDVVIEDLALDGNGANNALLDGNYAGCIFLQNCSRYTIRRVEARNYNGDGMSWQICHDVVVENCYSHDHKNLGLHPGSGSQRPVIRHNRVERNWIGIFFCWGVKYGLAEHNTAIDNRDFGVSIGHNDTDNVVRNNVIQGSGKVGVLLRDESSGKDFWPNRNTIENNRIVNSGPADGVAIDIQGKTRDITIAKNEIREMRQPMHRTGIRIGKNVGPVTMADNQIDGFSVAIADQRKV